MRDLLSLYFFLTLLPLVFVYGVVVAVLALTFTITVQVLTDTLTIHLQTVRFLTITGDLFLFGSLFLSLFGFEVSLEALLS